ncbi:Uncharacterized iron-regulated membrane protein [Rheinheimera pacifica]|uniref:Uncharacterized iron-regulated membrane protein n=1 Tax=Rheinheimera pacifica TaxID=173990 RepID=A0A1H6JXZ9_9GAMM|nr:PepSY-associated TM helix domain-containing protein [Rheinheimera pacifica]SEH64235.1 Uncharacterized iron-regulated membrane protein [Rheinheimera pacifica]
MAFTASRLHRYLSWALGIWLVLLSVSGAVLLYKNPLLRWQYPQLQHIQPVANISHWGPLLNQLQQDAQFRYVKFPAADALWLEAVTFDNQRHYYNQQHQLLLTRDVHGDWLDWLYDFHLHLLSGESGHTANGVIGLLSMLLLLSGLWQWWPRRFNRRLFNLPKPDSSLRSLRQYHSVLALLLLPLLLLTSATGAMMVFSTQTQTVLHTLIPPSAPPAQPLRSIAPVPLNATNWTAALQSAQQHWPVQALRLVSLRQKDSDPISFRAKAADEWHPNGRGVLQINPSDNSVLFALPAAELALADRLRNSFYPLHLAAVGGTLYQLALLCTGVFSLVLLLLGLLFSWRRLKARSARYGAC